MREWSWKEVFKKRERDTGKDVIHLFREGREEF